MNSCRRKAFCDLKHGLSAAFSPGKPPTNRRRWPEAAPPLSRSHAASAADKPAAGSRAGAKPRLRAIDLAQKVQREKAPPPPAAAEPSPSRQQKRVTELKRLSLQLQGVHPNVLAKHLHRGVLYQDRDVVVINKPLGVPVRDDSGATSISSVLPVLSKMMDGLKIKSDSQLFPCLKLEKETTGAFLLARSEKVVEHVLNLHRNNQVQRTYWVITVGVPVPAEGVIDIPVIEREVTGPRPHFKMALSPLYRMNDTGDGVTKVRAHRQAHPAATKYRVLDSSSGCSLVELQPLTGEKHQMRVHMALALTCPILGDHKYSHSNKLAPQKLPDRVLVRLGLEQSKIRHLPLHVHARHLALSGPSGAAISASCAPPKYFIQTLNQLQLTLPDGKD